MIGPSATELLEDMARLPQQLGMGGAFLLAYHWGETPHLGLEDAILLLWWSVFLLTLALVVMSWSSRRFHDAHTILDPRHKRRMSPLLLFTAPFLEELFFRGVLIQILSLWVSALWAIGLQALAWAVLHERPRLLPLDVGFGLAFGLAAVDVGLWSAILFHLLLNLRAYRRPYER